MHLTHSQPFLVASAAALLWGSTATGRATGFRLPDQDAFATARGEAFVATADNPSAIYYNPAGIVQAPGLNLRGGVYLLDLQTSYENVAHNSFDNEKQWHAIPQLFLTYTPEKVPIAVGLGVYSPYGLSSGWPQDTGFRTVATEGSLTYGTIHPTVAWRIVPPLSVAAGLTVNYAQIDLRQGLTPIPNNDEYRFHGDGWDVGFNLGVLWQPHPKVSLGASYRSATTMDFEGYSNLRVDTAVPPVFPFPFEQRVDAHAEFPFPPNVVVGLSFRPTPAWNLEFDVDWTDWNRVNSVRIQQTGLPSQSRVLDWESSHYYELGATPYVGSGWWVSAGYIYNENSVPDAHYSPLVGDLNRNFLSVGVGFKGSHFHCDAAYQYGWAPTRTVEGSAPSAWGQSADGRYDFRSHALLLTAGWQF